MVSSCEASATATPRDSGSCVPLPYRLPPARPAAFARPRSPAITAASADATSQ